MRRRPPPAPSLTRPQPLTGHRRCWVIPPAAELAAYLAARILSGTDSRTEKKMRRSAIYRAHPAEDRRGFTLIELVTVITIVGVLAAFVAPRFWSQQTFSDRGYVDELAAALRSTQKAAVISGCPARV